MKTNPTNAAAQNERADQLTKLHVKGDPVIVFNIWDPGSAKALQEIGVKVIATGSWSVAAAYGCGDGEKLPFDFAIENLERIVASVDLPVTIDLEGGYAESPAQLQENITRVIQAGAVGINFEDQVMNGDGLYSMADQAARIKALREAATAASVALFINARTDLFLQSDPTAHPDHLELAIERSVAYAEAGASGFFAPGLSDAKQIEELCKRSPLPVNIMMMPGVPTRTELAGLGVARVSYGPIPYRLAMDALKAAGCEALSSSRPIQA